MSRDRTDPPHLASAAAGIADPAQSSTGDKSAGDKAWVGDKAGAAAAPSPWSGKVRRFFGDREHEFCLTLDAIQEIEERTGVGILALLTRLPSRDVRLREIREVIRCGLVHGDMRADPAGAWQLMRRYFDERLQIAAHWLLALEIIQPLLDTGDDPPPKPQGEAEAAAALAPDISTGADSTRPPARSATRQRKSAP